MGWLDFIAITHGREAVIVVVGVAGSVVEAPNNFGVACKSRAGIIRAGPRAADSLV
jgi:hypothetical protein